MRWDVNIHMFLSNIVSNTYNLMNSFEIPGTTATPWDVLVYIIIFSVIAFILSKWLGLEVGVWDSGYRSARAKGMSYGQSVRSANRVSRSRYVGSHYPSARQKHRR